MNISFEYILVGGNVKKSANNLIKNIIRFIK